jgi:bifunctional DNA-binding transcriptional regulator/antitoxin component of YhaV-PrlF toxin-antitoxin module
MNDLIMHEKIEVRRVQSLQGEKSFTIVLPKEFAIQLGIGKGDFLKCLVDGKRLIVEKMQV